MNDDGPSIYDVAELTQTRARFWLAMDGWTADDAAHLLCGIEPDPALLAEWGRTPTFDFAAQSRYEHAYRLRRTLLQKAFEAGALNFPAAPSAVVAWAMGKEMRLPAPLIPKGAVVRKGRWVPADVEGLDEEVQPAASVLPCFADVARPTAVPPELLALHPDVRVYVTRRIGRQNSSFVCSAGDYREMIELRSARHAEDLFTVNEAAQVITDSRGGKSATEWVKEIRAAHRAGALAIRDCESCIPLKPANPSDNAVIPIAWTAVQDCVSNVADLVKGADVDAWLRATAGYGFPETTRDATPAVDTRVTIAEAKRLILQGSPQEYFIQVYSREDDTVKSVLDEHPKSIFASFLDEDFTACCQQLGIVPRWKYRPSQTGYTGDSETDDLYTVTRDELAQLAEMHGQSQPVEQSQRLTDPPATNSSNATSASTPALNTASDFAKAGAHARHAPNRDAKALVLQWWADHRETMNKEQAADAISAERLVEQSRETVRKWLIGA